MRLKNTLSLIFIAPALILSACGDDAGSPQNIVVSASDSGITGGGSFESTDDLLRSIDGPAFSVYNAAFADAASSISAYEYDKAESILKELKEKLDADRENDIASLTFLKAQTDYALGRVYILYGDKDKAFDFYNSALAYYKNSLGEDAAFSADTKLQIAYLSERRDVLRNTEAIEGSGADDIYKDLAYCLSADAYINLDNKAEADKYLQKIRTFAEDSSKINADTADSSSRLYGESPEVSAALGRLTEADRHRKAVESMADLYHISLDTESVINLLENDLAELDGDDLKSEEWREWLYENLAFHRLYYLGADNNDEYVQKALAQCEKLYPVGLNQASANVQLAQGFYTAGDYEYWYEYLSKAKDLTGDDYHNRVRALIDLLLADYHRVNGNYAEAVREAEESIDIYESLIMDGTSAIGSAYNIIANCYTAAGNTSKAMEAYDKSIDVYREPGHEIELAASLRNRALVTNNTYHEHSEALKLAREAIAIVEQSDGDTDAKTKAAVYMVMADILKPADPEYEKIEEYSKKAFRCLENAVGNTDQYYANYYYNYGNYLKDNERYDDAVENLTKCEELFANVYDETYKYPVDVLFDLGYCMYMNDDYENALLMFERAKAFEKEAIEKMMKPEWCSYLQQNLEKVQFYIDTIHNMISGSKA